MLWIAEAFHMHNLLYGMHVQVCFPNVAAHLPCMFAFSQIPAIILHTALLKTGRLQMPALLWPITGTREVMYTANPKVCLQVTYLPPCMNLVLFQIALTMDLNACS
jgi:hypothetical protein